MPQPGRGGIDVWRINFPQPAPVVAALRTVLSDEEVARASRFVFPGDQAQYVVMHGALRLLLAGLLRIDAMQIRFSANENGKPFIADFSPPHVPSSGSFNVPRNDQPFVPRSDANDAATSMSGPKRDDFVPPIPDIAPQFSISHTQRIGLVAISLAPYYGPHYSNRPGQAARFEPDSFIESFEAFAPVGVDVEYIQPEFPFEDIADRYFPSAEAAALRSLPVAEQRCAFFAAWVRKEAWVKAAGAGLDQLPSLDPGLAQSLDDGSLRKATDPRMGIASVWLQDLEAGPSHTAALAVRGVPSVIRCIAWQVGTGYL